MKIKHHQSVTDYKKVEEIYTKKDGVKIKYVCTTDLSGGLNPSDIFYRETPHPEFGNRYFGIYYLNHVPYITAADIIESKDFGMIMCGDSWVYSAHRHDYITCGGKVIDGGRAYIRGFGFTMFSVLDGKFIMEEET